MGGVEYGRVHALTQSKTAKIDFQVLAFIIHHLLLFCLLALMLFELESVCKLSYLSLRGDASSAGADDAIPFSHSATIQLEPSGDIIVPERLDNRCLLVIISQG
jgi:hypothetical protein